MQSLSRFELAISGSSVWAPLDNSPSSCKFSSSPTPILVVQAGLEWAVGIMFFRIKYDRLLQRQIRHHNSRSSRPWQDADCQESITVIGLTNEHFRYLRWLGIVTKTFSVAKYRRLQLGGKLKADFFDPSNQAALDKRTEIADQALLDLVKWLQENGGQMAVLDATNIVGERRIFEYDLLKRHGISTIFLECIYEREDSMEQCLKEMEFNYHPEYESWSREEAAMDFMKRLSFYKCNYKTLSADDPYPFIQFFGDSQRIEAKEIGGYLPTKIVYYLMNSTTHNRRSIYLVIDNEKRTDPDGRLTPLVSRKQGVHLDDFIREKLSSEPTLQIWTGTNGSLAQNIYERPQLDPKAEGEVENMDPEEIRDQFPEDYELHQRDSFSHRYPRAESYKDVTLRLEGIIMEIEKTPSKILIIAHESVLRCIYAYYVEIKPRVLPMLIIGYPQFVTTTRPYH
jgi:6-phosphofructo-2-kinase/fructose-2,6-biphosphatase 4